MDKSRGTAAPASPSAGGPSSSPYPPASEVPSYQEATSQSPSQSPSQPYNMYQQQTDGDVGPPTHPRPPQPIAVAPHGRLPQSSPQSFPMVPMTPAGQPMQQQQQQQQNAPKYNTAVPLHALNCGPAPVDCPVCGQRDITSVSYVVGNTTNAWAAVVCFLTCLGCIPYLISGTKDVAHRCGKCGALLATWHRSGYTEIHLYS